MRDNLEASRYWRLLFILVCCRSGDLLQNTGTSSTCSLEWAYSRCLARKWLSVIHNHCAWKFGGEHILAFFVGVAGQETYSRTLGPARAYSRVDKGTCIYYICAYSRIRNKIIQGRNQNKPIRGRRGQACGAGRVCFLKKLKVFIYFGPVWKVHGGAKDYFRHPG